MTDNIIPLNNITKLDIPFERVLEQAKTNLEHGVIIGWDNDGNLYVASSIADGGEVNWLLDKAKQALLNIEED
jgi:hypothetical protein